MVSEKLIVILLVLAIILSVVSIAISFSVNVTEAGEEKITGSGSGAISLFVESSRGEGSENEAG